MFIGNTWCDSANKRVARYNFAQGVGAFNRALFMSCAGAIIFCTMQPIFSNPLLGVATAISILLVWLLVHVKRTPHEEELVRDGLLADRESYAFRALERKLDALGVPIRRMDDKLDHEVGIQHISRYLRVVQEGSFLADAKETAESLRLELKGEITQSAKEYAAHIKHCFDQRELVRQALERKKKEEVTRLKCEQADALAPYHDAKAVLWLANHQKGLLE